VTANNLKRYFKNFVVLMTFKVTQGVKVIGNDTVTV